MSTLAIFLAVRSVFFAAKAAYRQADIARSTVNIAEIITFINHNFGLKRPLQIDILDNGCEPSGQQLTLLAEQTTGRVVGTNIYKGFPAQTVKVCRPNNEFYYMNGQNLNFADNSFDLVISLNVLEHISPPRKILTRMRSRAASWWFWLFCLVSFMVWRNGSSRSSRYGQSESPRIRRNFC